MWSSLLPSLPSRETPPAARPSVGLLTARSTQGQTVLGERLLEPRQRPRAHPVKLLQVNDGHTGYLSEFRIASGDKRAGCRSSDALGKSVIGGTALVGTEV